MLRRLKRLHDFELSLQIHNDQFICPPHESQRNWLVNSAVNEFVADLTELDKLAKRFVPGQSASSLVTNRTQLLLSDEEIMEDWQIPLMRAMVNIVTEKKGDILEIGFGRGISANYIQQTQNVRSHTLVECNDSIVESFHQWKKNYPSADIHLLHGKWQDLIDKFTHYDGIFFHTYVLDEAEQIDYIGQSTTFAEHFFPIAAKYLRKGGVFTYISNEVDSLSRSHQRALLQYFESLSLQKIKLDLPSDIKDSWWADSMMVVKAV
ncbi:MAG: class I SAM-dependent methyltransferase, partial [Gammaproteobacteria bacterium]|nr:class I SAM-dependent methyltransferase [Gammaproteobacteria bacterium]